MTKVKNVKLKVRFKTRNSITSIRNKTANKRKQRNSVIN